MPKISVIVPVYGVEKYLKEAVDSILNQTMTDLEIILIDDGGKDSCPKIIDEYAEKDSRIIPIHKPNGGYGQTCNIGLERATGEYVAILEPDDYIDKDDFFNQSIILLKNENNSFFDSSLLEKLKLQYPNRIELLFFDIMRMLLIIKEAKKVNNSSTVETICIEIETLYNLIISCLNTKVIYLTESSSLYIYQPVTLLKLWNNNSDDNDVSSYSELNTIFFIKTLIKVKKIDKAFKYLKSLVDIGDSNISPLIFYYFGKVISLAITFRINTGVVGNFINQRSNYSVIKVAMISYSSEKTRNYIRLEKNYLRLAQISKYFKIDQDTIDNYLNKAKMYKNYINNQNKI